MALAWLPAQEPTPFLLGTFSTELNRSEWNRNTNVQMAARKVDGVYIMPGGVFSFNSIVGERGVEQGYLDAPVYTPAGKMQVVAGGLCQLSSTIYNAALLSDLKILERHPHSLTVRYLIPGRDATVSRYNDLKFSNTLRFPLRLRVEVVGRELRCAVYGTRALDAQIQIEVNRWDLPNGRVAARAIRRVWRSGQSERADLLSEDSYERAQ